MQRDVEKLAEILGRVFSLPNDDINIQLACHLITLEGYSLKPRKTYLDEKELTKIVLTQIPLESGIALNVLGIQDLEAKRIRRAEILSKLICSKLSLPETKFMSIREMVHIMQDTHLEGNCTDGFKTAILENYANAIHTAMLAKNAGIGT